MKIDRYLNEGFSWASFLSWSFISAIKYFVLITQITKALAKQEPPANSTIHKEFYSRLNQIVDVITKVYVFPSKDMQTFVLKDSIYISSAIEDNLTKDEVIAVLLYEYNSRKNNLQTKENITGHLKFGLPFEMFVALLYGMFPSLMK